MSRGGISLDKKVVVVSHRRRKKTKGRVVSPEEFDRLFRPRDGGLLCEACREYKTGRMHVLLPAYVTLPDGVRTRLHPVYYVCPTCAREKPSMLHSLSNMDLARGRNIFEVYGLCGHGTNATEAADVAQSHTDTYGTTPSAQPTEVIP